MLKSKAGSTFDWLKQYLDIQDRIAYLQWNLRRYELELSRWQDGDLRNVKINEKSKSANLEGKIASIRDEITMNQTVLEDLDHLLQTFKGVEYQTMYLKYCKGYTLEAIAEQESYSVEYIRKLHAELVRRVKFLDKFRDVIQTNRARWKREG